MSQDITNLPQLDSMIAALERLARDTTIPTERVATLFELAERRERTIQRRAFNFDMNCLQAEIGQIQKDKPNPAFHSRYATEEAIDRAARPYYTKYGFSIRYGTAPPAVPGNINVVCTVAHRDGYFEEHPLEGPVSIEGSKGGRMATTPIQAVGSTVTYLKRALIRMVLNLVTADNSEDDDGETARVAQQHPADRREQINRDVPVAQPKRTWSQVLAEIEAKFVAATSRAEVDAVLATEFVQKAMDNARNSARDMLTSIIKEAMDRTADEPAPPQYSSSWPGPDPEAMRREREQAGG